MGLTIILGPSGAGKTEWMYQKALNTAKENPERTVLFVVPEQFSLQTMKDLLVRSEQKSMLNIEVLSFMRLSYRIFAELSVETGELLSDTGKTLLLKRVLSKTADKLTVFASNVKKPGFLDELKSMISECYQYGITPELLQEKAKAEEQEDGNPLLARKLKDLALLFQGFTEQIDGKYQPTETVFDTLAKVFPESGAFRNCICFLDGFTGFTPSQYSLLRTLFQYAGETYLSLTGDASVRKDNLKEHQLFFFTGQTCRLVKELAEQTGTTVVYQELLKNRENSSNATKKGNGKLSGDRFTDAPALRALEQGLFRYPVKSKVSCEERIKIAARQNRQEEAAFIAADIEKRIRTEGLRYGKIAVITGDVAGYGDILLEECRKANIPAFLDSKRKIVHNPLVSVIRSVLLNAQNSYSFDSVFRYLKSGFSAVTPEETAMLENYCIACGIRGESSWKKEWHYQGRAKGETNLSKLNELREKVLLELSEITKLLKDEKTAGGRTRALYHFVDQMQMEEKLLKMAGTFEEKGDFVRGGEYRQIYGKILLLFDHFVELLDKEEMELSEYVSLVETGLHELKFGLVPNGSDFIVIGDVTRTRLSDIDVLYLAGANEGVTPAMQSGGGLLSEAERDELKTKELQLAPGRRESMFTEQFYLYQMLTKPRKNLILTFSRLSASGEELSPSYFLRRVQELYTDLIVEEKESDRYQDILKNDYGRNFFLKEIRNFSATGEKTPQFCELYRGEKEGQTELTDRLLNAAFFGNPAASISEDTAKKLYGDILYGSVTRLEQFASCAFAHFLQYGLSLQERAEYKVSAPELGTLYHEALRIFTERVKRENSFQSLTEEQAGVYCEESVAEAARLFKNGVFEGNEKNSYLLVRTERILRRTIKMLMQQMKGSLFTPEQCEADYELKEKLYSLHGRIDRFDLCQNEGIDYLRVIDYKSGEKKLDLSEAYYGLQVQLLCYLKAAKEIVKETNHIEPETAGILYSHIKDPFLDREKYSEEAEQKEYRPNGLLNRSPSAITAMDQSMRAANGGLMQKTASRLVNAETDAEGQLKQTASVIPGENFDILTEFITKKLDEEAKEILSGAAQAKPSRYKKKTPCEYCKFSSVCGFDSRLPEYGYKDLPKIPETEIFTKLKGE